jgi:hypothetical protein
VGHGHGYKAEGGDQGRHKYRAQASGGPTQNRRFKTFALFS